MKLNSWIYENVSDEKTIQDLEKIAQDIQDEQYYLAGKNDGIIQRNKSVEGRKIILLLIFQKFYNTE